MRLLLIFVVLTKGVEVVSCSVDLVPYSGGEVGTDFSFLGSGDGFQLPVCITTHQRPQARR